VIGTVVPVPRVRVNVALGAETLKLAGAAEAMISVPSVDKVFLRSCHSARLDNSPAPWWGLQR
jgi:hypothetical protein